MSLRALGLGAADGLAEWADPSAFQPLVAYIVEPRNNEHSRLAAGAALGWIGTEADLKQLAQRVASPGTSKDTDFVRSCWLEGLRARPIGGLSPLLLPLFARAQPLELRRAAARAVGRNRLDASTETQLLKLTQRADTATFAALSLVLGGSSQAAVAAVQRHAAVTQDQSAELLNGLALALSSFSVDDVADGTLFRFIENADALASTNVGKIPQIWAREQLAVALQGLVYDNGPHSVTRVVLNDQLRRVATGSDPRLAALAVRAFTLLNEGGHLRYLSRTRGPVAAAASRAYQDLLSKHTPRPGEPPSR